MLSKTIHLRPLKSQNYIRVRTPERAARIHERNALNHLDHDYKPILKTSYDSNIFKFQKEKISKPSESRDYKTLITKKRKEEDEDYESTHYAGYLIHKKKKYNDQLKSLNNVPMSKIISKEQYENIRSASIEFSPTAAAERGEEADKRNVYRKNLFISKPFTDINKDFKFQPLIRNAQTSSEDTPYWFQGTAKYYTSENFDLTKNNRSKLNNLPKADIFGKTLTEYPKQDNLFTVQPPSKGQRYELNKMVVIEKRTKNDFNPRIPHVALRWEENPEKQSYDRTRITWKIGNETDPFIKTVRDKASFDPLVAFKKIGEEKDAVRLKKEKNLNLKIGHPKDLYSYTKKSRDDGFYGNRKEILGENYQRNNFFVG